MITVFTHLKRWIPPVIFVLFLGGTTVFAFLGGIDEAATTSAKIFHHTALAVCFLCMWATLNSTGNVNSPVPTQVFWQITVAIIAAWILIFMVLQIPGGFSETHIPAVSIVHVKAALLTTLFAGLSFIVIQRCGHLVRFRRTRQSERIWHLLMLSIFLAFAAVTPLHHQFGREDSGALGILGLVALGIAVIFIFLNTVRLPWIFRLSFKQKLATVGLGAVVVALTASTLLILFRPGTAFSAIPNINQYLNFYSLPLTAVIVLSTTFGFVYALTSVLSLIFHLPTTGDYRRSVDEMAAIQALSVLVRDVADAAKLYHWIVSTPVDAGRGIAAWLMVPDLESGFLKLQIIAAYNIDASLADASCELKEIHQDAVRTRELVTIQDTVLDRRTEKGTSAGIRSLVAVPLTTSTEVLGTLFVSRDIAHAFEKDDIESIWIFASQATLVLENVRLLEAKIEQERLTSELNIARNVQQRLLPQTMPRFANLSIAASSIPAHEVGGDYYDLLELGEGKLAFIVADVSGKGTSAAFYMAEMQGIFQALARLAPEPNNFLYHANQALGESLEKNIFITAIYGIIDCHSGEISIARAGHTPAILADKDGTAKLLRSSGLGIGLNRSKLFVESLEVIQLTLNPGDMIVLYTDGVIESRNPEDTDFGYDRLMESINKFRHEPAQGVHDSVRETIDKFMGLEKRYDDDLTLLVIKWHGRAQHSGQLA